MSDGQMNRDARGEGAFWREVGGFCPGVDTLSWRTICTTVTYPGMLRKETSLVQCSDMILTDRFSNVQGFLEDMTPNRPCDVSGGMLS